MFCFPLTNFLLLRQMLLRHPDHFLDHGAPDFAADPSGILGFQLAVVPLGERYTHGLGNLEFDLVRFLRVDRIPFPLHHIGFEGIDGRRRNRVGILSAFASAHNVAPLSFKFGMEKVDAAHSVCLFSPVHTGAVQTKTLHYSTRLGAGGTMDMMNDSLATEVIASEQL